MGYGQNAKTADGVGGHQFIASDFKALEKNTLRRSVSFLLPSGLKIKDVSVHKRDGKRWIGLPGKPYTKQDGSVSYSNLIDFETAAARFRFQRLALKAVDRLEGGK